MVAEQYQQQRQVANPVEARTISQQYPNKPESPAGERARLGPGVMSHHLLSMSAFMDGTVRKAGVTGGAHYFPVMYLINNLPTRQIFLYRNVFYDYVACYVVASLAVCN